MKLELYFEDLATELVGAVADVYTEDLAVADMPGGLLGTATTGEFSVAPGRPAVTASVDLPSIAQVHEPAVVVRVRARTVDDQPVEFLNINATPVPKHTDAPVRVALSRIK